jgi:hypothetical protein
VCVSLVRQASRTGACPKGHLESSPRGRCGGDSEKFLCATTPTQDPPRMIYELWPATPAYGDRNPGLSRANKSFADRRVTGGPPCSSPRRGAASALMLETTNKGRQRQAGVAHRPPRAILRMPRSRGRCARDRRAGARLRAVIHRIVGAAISL